MKIAILTIQHKELYFLPLWYKYYKDVGDLYVINHNCEPILQDVNNIEEKTELFFNHEWLCETVKKHHRRLLKDYDFVIYAEPDEIIIPVHTDLKTYVEGLKKGIYRMQGYEVEPERDQKPIEWDKPILKQRKYWVFKRQFCKPNIASEPVNWVWGFHSSRDQQTELHDVYLAHLHRIDYDVSWKKTKYQSTLPKPVRDVQGRYGYHNYIPNEEDFKKFFYNDNIKVSEIPDWIKEKF